MKKSWFLRERGDDPDSSAGVGAFFLFAVDSLPGQSAVCCPCADNGGGGGQRNSDGFERRGDRRRPSHHDGDRQGYRRHTVIDGLRRPVHVPQPSGRALPAGSENVRIQGLC